MRAAPLASSLSLLLGICACARQAAAPAVPWAPDPAPDLGAVVARVGEVPIFAEEVRAQALRTGKTPRQAVEDLVAFHLLAEHAREHWPPADPAGDDLRKRVLVQRILELELEPAIAPDELPESEVRELYDRAIEAFVHPPIFEVSVLSILFDRKIRREDARRTMQELKAFLKAQPPDDPEEFRALAREPRWSEQGVRGARFLQGEPGRPYGAEFVSALSKLKGPGDVTGIVEDEHGLLIAYLVRDHPAKNITFEQARHDLREQYYPRWRQTRFEEFAARLSAARRIELYLARPGVAADP